MRGVESNGKTHNWFKGMKGEEEQLKSKRGTEIRKKKKKVNFT